MTPEQQAVNDAQEQLAQLEHEAKALLEEEKQISARLKAIGGRLNELRPHGYLLNCGLIAGAKARLALAQRKADDATKPRLTIKRGEFAVPPTIDVVLVKVTPKRIYVREAGGDFETYIPRDGSQMHYGWQVDMDALLKWAGCAQTDMATEAT